MSISSRALLNSADTALAASLEENDILFINSSHIMLPGMDVDIQFNRLFPTLRKGVIVHVHDTSCRTTIRRTGR